MSVLILTSIYQTTNSENNNTDEKRERTLRVPGSEIVTIRERFILIPSFGEIISLPAKNFRENFFYPNRVFDEDIPDKYRYDHNVPKSPA